MTCLRTSTTQGARLARRLKFVLDHQLPLALESLSQEAEGDPRSRFVLIGALPVGNHLPQAVSCGVEVGGGSVGVQRGDGEGHRRALRRVRPAVRRAPAPGALHQGGGRARAVAVAGADVPAPARCRGLALLERLGLALLGRITRLTRLTWDDQLVQAARGPLRLPILAFVLSVTTPPLFLPPVWAHGSASSPLAPGHLRGMVRAPLPRHGLGGRGEPGGEGARGMPGASGTQLAVLRQVPWSPRLVAAARC